MNPRALTTTELQAELDRLLGARRSCVRLGQGKEAFECTMEIVPIRVELLRRNQLAAYFLPVTQAQPHRAAADSQSEGTAGPRETRAERLRPSPAVARETRR